MTMRKSRALTIFLWSSFALLAVRTEGAAVTVTKLTDKVIEYRLYEPAASKSVDITDLELWPQMPAQENPVEKWWSTEPDLRYYLVSRGLAKLREPGKA